LQASEVEYVQPVRGRWRVAHAGGVVYLFIFVLLRFFGKKPLGQMSPFDLIMLLLISEEVQNAMLGDDKSVLGGLIVATFLFALSEAFGYTEWRSKRAGRTLDGTPSILVRNGQVYSDVLAREQVTRSELMEALRREGCTSLNRVRYAVLENDGNITVGLRSPGSAAALAEHAPCGARS
jgi:uncharacterized membrane protein YcaP (DUF421 family)